MAHLIPSSEIERYSRPPSATAVSQVSALQIAIRDALGSDYETFLQGSYKNDTSVREINDVDIVAIRKSTVSSVFSHEQAGTSISWQAIFEEVATRLAASDRFRGRLAYGDKCIRVEGERKADVVPAVRIGTYDQDPIAVYSFREQRERENHPRTHYEKGVQKHEATGARFKPIVRMMKAWAKNHWADGSVAPSFYIESLVANVPADQFVGDLASSLLTVNYWIVTNLKPSPPPIVFSVAGDKDVLVAGEWHPDQYNEFHQQLTLSLGHIANAFQATRAAAATWHWRSAFNE